MSDDPLMSALGAVARDEAEDDPRLEALVRGTATETERHLLVAEAKDDPALAMALEAYRPLDRPDVDRVVDAAVTAFGEPSAKIIPFPRRALLVAGGLAAAAAAVALVLLQMPSGPPLAVYQSELVGGDQEFRGQPEPVRERRPFSPRSRVEVRLRPDVAVEGASEAVAYFIHDGQTREVKGQFERSAEGAFRLVGSAGQLFEGRLGDVELVLAVGRPGIRERQAEIVAKRNASIDGVQVFVELLELRRALK